MGIVFRAAGVGVGVESGTLTPGIPAGTTTDDIMICVVDGGGNFGTAYTWPAGWAEIFNNAGNPRLEVRWKRAGASESSPSITGAVESSVAQIGSFSGCITIGSPIDQVSAAGITSAPTFTYPAITPTVDNTFLCVVGGSQSQIGDSSTDITGINPTISALLLTVGTTLGSQDAGAHLGGGIKSDTTTSGSRTGTTGGGGFPLRSFQFNLIPGVSPATPKFVSAV